MKIRIISVCILIILSACNFNRKNLEEIFTEIAADTNKVTLFEGLFPCKDCEGIKTVLEIKDGDGVAGAYTYTLTQTFLNGANDNKLILEGEYDIERGFENDSDALVYILNWDKEESEREYFVQYSMDSTQIYKLDNEKRPILSEFEYTLRKM